MSLAQPNPQPESVRHRIPVLVAGICATLASIGNAEEPVIPPANPPVAAAIEPISILDALVLPQKPPQTSEPAAVPTAQAPVQAAQQDSDKKSAPEAPISPLPPEKAATESAPPKEEEPKATPADPSSAAPEASEKSQLAPAQELTQPGESEKAPAAEVTEQPAPPEIEQKPEPVEARLPAPPTQDVSPEKGSNPSAAESPGTTPEGAEGKWNLWQYAQNGALWVTLVGIPFLWLTWRKRADEALERWKVNDDIKNGRLESDIRLNIHRFEEKNGVWSMQVINTGRITVKELFGDQHIYADVLGKAASLSDASQPFPIFNFKEALATFNQMTRAFVRRTSLPTESLMAYNCRVRTRDLISAEFNPERRSLDTEKSFEQRRVFGILVREKMGQASTLVLCVLPETSLARFGDDAWVSELKANSDAHDIARIDQLKLAYEKEKDFLNGHAAKSVFPWANILFPVGAKKEARPRNSSAQAEVPNPEYPGSTGAAALEVNNSKVVDGRHRVVGEVNLNHLP